MKNLWFVFLLLFAFGCASVGVKEDTESHVTKKDELIRMAGEAAAVDRIWPFYGLSAGTNALNAISEGNIGANDMAMGRDSNGYTYIFYFDDDYTDTCISPSCIRASDDGDSSSAWLATAQFYVDAFVSSAADGEHFIDPSNSSAFPTGIAEGSATCRDDRDACFVYDGAEWLPLYAGKYSEYTATGNVDADDCWGGVISNNGASGAIVLNLPLAVKGMRCTFVRVDNDGDLTINEGSGDVIDGATGNIVLDVDAESVTLYAISDSTWVVVADSKAPDYNL